MTKHREALAHLSAGVTAMRCGTCLQDVRWSTLQKLHLGGHEGVHIPTLQAFLQ